MAASKKSARQIVDEAMTTTSVSNDRRTETPVQLLPGYDKALARARALISPTVGWATASIQAVASVYSVKGANSESLGGDVRRIWKSIGEELRR